MPLPPVRWSSSPKVTSRLPEHPAETTKPAAARKSIQGDWRRGRVTETSSSWGAELSGRAAVDVGSPKEPEAEACGPR
jgi:hypothetical protein